MYFQVTKIRFVRYKEIFRVIYSLTRIRMIFIKFADL